MSVLATAALIGGTAALAKAGAKGAGMIAEKRSIGGKASKAALQKDITKLQKGQLGMTAAQKRGAMGEAVRGINASTRGTEAQLRREAAATGGFGRSGAQAQQLQGLTQQRADAAGLGAAGIEKASQEQAYREKASILARAAAQGQKVKADWAELGDAGAEGVEMGLAAGWQERYEEKLEGAKSPQAAGPQTKSP